MVRKRVHLRVTAYFLVYVPASLQGNTTEGPYFEEKTKHFTLLFYFILLYFEETMSKSNIKVGI